MPRRPDDDRRVDRATRPGASNSRMVVLIGGFALAAAATLAVFLTDNPQYLRIAVVAVAWAFVLAAFAAGRRTGDRAEAAARESELRRAYELELEREVSARREYELELENELRRDTEDAMRNELDALRGDIASLAGLREEVARVSALRGDIAALTDLRDQVARVASLRDDVAALSGLRDDVAGLSTLRDELGQLAELRADMGRLRAELTEQLSSEMLVERIVMRTQASRLPADQGRLESGAGRALEGAASWTDDLPPRELTGGWPAIRLDEPRETQQFEQVRIDRTVSRPPVPSAEPAPSWEMPSWEKPSWETPSAQTPAWQTPSWETPERERTRPRAVAGALDPVGRPPHRLDVGPAAAPSRRARFPLPARRSHPRRPTGGRRRRSRTSRCAVPATPPTSRPCRRRPPRRRPPRRRPPSRCRRRCPASRRRRRGTGWPRGRSWTRRRPRLRRPRRRLCRPRPLAPRRRRVVGGRTSPLPYRCRTSSRRRPAPGRVGPPVADSAHHGARDSAAHGSRAVHRCPARVRPHRLPVRRP